MVKIDENYSFNADTRCYTLYEKIENKKDEEEDLSKLDKDVKVKDGFRVVGYYVSIPSMLKGICNRELRKSIDKEELKTLVEVKNKINELNEFIDSLKLDF